jgi:hypothetical protein
MQGWYGAEVGVPAGDQPPHSDWPMLNTGWEDIHLAPEDIMISGMEGLAPASGMESMLADLMGDPDTAMWGMEPDQPQPPPR